MCISLHLSHRHHGLNFIFEKKRKKLSSFLELYPESPPKKIAKREILNEKLALNSFFQ